MNSKESTALQTEPDLRGERGRVMTDVWIRMRRGIYTEPHINFDGRRELNLSLWLSCLAACQQNPESKFYFFLIAGRTLAGDNRERFIHFECIRNNLEFRIKDKTK